MKHSRTVANIAQVSTPRELRRMNKIARKYKQQQARRGVRCE